MRLTYFTLFGNILRTWVAIVSSCVTGTITSELTPAQCRQATLGTSLECFFIRPCNSLKQLFGSQNNTQGLSHPGVHARMFYLFFRSWHILKTLVSSRFLDKDVAKVDATDCQQCNNVNFDVRRAKRKWRSTLLVWVVG